MFNVRPIPATTPVDIRKIYSLTNQEITGRFKQSEAWAFFELPGHKKFAISVSNLCDLDYEAYEQVFKDAGLPSIPKALYERMRSFAELNIMMRGVS